MEKQYGQDSSTYDIGDVKASKTFTRRPAEGDLTDEAKKQRGNIAALRALRVLHLLRARTDRETYLSSDELIADLSMPSDRVLVPIATERKSLYAAIASLRTAGYSIDSKTGNGYALIEHPLSENDAEELARIVESCPYLGNERRHELLCSLSSLAAPSVRERVAGERHTDKQTAERVTLTTSEFRIFQANQLMRCAIEHHRPVSFAFEHNGQQDDGKQQLFYPRALVERQGTHFATGYLHESATEPPRMRTYKLTRLRDVRLTLPDGSIALAAFSDADSSASVPSEELNSKA